MAFRKTAINFHYEFNVRHMTNVFQGLLQAKSEIIQDLDKMVKLWVHEMERIYGDRLVNAAHLQQYRDIILEQVKRNFNKANMTKHFQAKDPEPLVFASFVGSLDEKQYDVFPSAEMLSQRLREALDGYNELNAVMDLVLFEDAMKHACKIARIISADAGHALLVGVGGSGKQSLTRLASSISQYTTVTIMISSTYGINDLKIDLQNYYTKSGVKDEGLCFLFTEGQITKEQFLVYINDLLSSGEIADLFDTDGVDTIVNNLTPAVKSEGLVPSKEVNWKFFIDRVRKNLHMSLCFSPVGDAFRNRARKFPALVNCTVIDWFHPWPYDALLSVADKFLADLEMKDEVRASVVKFLPFSFDTVQKYSEEVLVKDRRYIYTTPKSFLELIKLFKSMLGKKQGALEVSLEKYENGVIRLQNTTSMVGELEETIKQTAVTVAEAKIEAQEQAAIVGKEKEIVDVEAEFADVKSAEANKVATEVNAKKQSV
jgi:dynein heavy chain